MLIGQRTQKKKMLQRCADSLYLIPSIHVDAQLIQYLLFLLNHPISTLFTATAPSFNKHSYKPEENGTL